MKNNDVKIYVEQNFGSQMVNIWAIEFIGMTQFNIHFDGDKLVKTEVSEMEILNSNDKKPMLRIPFIFSKMLFKAIAEYNSEKGIKVKHVHMIEGELNAKNEHLKDLQMIVKKALKIEP